MIAALATGLTFTASQAQAACDGGITVDKFCISDNIQMNWWSAYTWCEAQGRHLASIYEMCPGWTGNDSSCNMGTFTSGSTFWTSTAEGTETAFRISKSGAGRYNRNLALAYAICY